MIELGKGSGELAGAGARCRNYDKRTSGLDVGIGAVAFFADDGINVGRIAFGKSMEISFDFVILEAVSKIFGLFLTFKKRDDDRTDVEALASQKFDEAEDFGFVRNEVIGADFGFFNGVRVNTKNDFGLVFEFLEEFDFKIW